MAGFHHMTICFMTLFLVHFILARAGNPPRIIKYPDSCDENDCLFLLKWEVTSDNNINFQLTSEAKDTNSWVAIGFGEINCMPNAGFVDCIQTPNGFNIQASHSNKYKNRPLIDNKLGLVPGSLSGQVSDGKIRCNFTHVIKVNQSHEEAFKVKDLDVPHYILLAHGPATAEGLKHKHHKPVYASEVKVNMLNDNATDGDLKRPLFVKFHGLLMVTVWMFLISLGTVTSRYLKNDWMQGIVICNKALWFQIHRSAMLISSLLVLAALLFIFSESEWTYYRNVHSIMGLTVMSMLIVNIFLGAIRPDVDSSRRCAFNIIHGLLGHSIHLVGIVTLFFGLRADYAMLPYWVSWVAIGFGFFRLFIDLVLSLMKYSSSNYSEISESDTQRNAMVWSWRFTIIVTYFIISLGTTLTIIIAIFVCPVVNHKN